MDFWKNETKMNKNKVKGKKKNLNFFFFKLQFHQWPQEAGSKTE